LTAVLGVTPILNVLRRAKRVHRRGPLAVLALLAVCVLPEEPLELER